MKASTIELLTGIVKATVPDRDEQAEVLRRLTPKEKRPDKQLTTREACALVGCVDKTLFRWAKLGKLHPRRLSPSWVRWSRNEIEDFLCAEG